MVIYNQKEGRPLKEREERKMMSYEEMDPMVAAEMFGASLEEMLEIAGVTLEEFYEDNKEETEG